MFENYRPSGMIKVTAALVVRAFGSVILAGGCSAEDNPIHTTVCEILTHSALYAGKDVAIEGIAELDNPWSLTDVSCPDFHLALDISFSVYFSSESQARVLIEALHRDDGIPHDREGIKAIFSGHFRVDTSRFPSRALILESVLNLEEMSRIPN